MHALELVIRGWGALAPQLFLLICHPQLLAQVSLCFGLCPKRTRPRPQPPPFRPGGPTPIQSVPPRERPWVVQRDMGKAASKVSSVAEEMGSTGGGAKSGSVIDKLTEAQLDEFREAFNSFDKVRCARRTQRRAPQRLRPLAARLQPTTTLDVVIRRTRDAGWRRKHRLQGAQGVDGLGGPEPDR